MSEYFGEHRADAGHGRRSLRGGAIVIAARGVIAVVQIVTVLFLARLLSPEDYGLVSMVAAITGFAPLLVSLGTPDAVVQRPRLMERDVSTLFAINLSLGVALTLAMAACGPLIARFYGEPRLTTIAAVSGLTFVLSALTCQHYALLRRAMRFQELAVIDVGSNLLSAAAAIAMAIAGFEYWALVARPVLQALLLTLGVWLRCRWLPGRPAMTPAAREMLRLGLNSTGFSLLDFVGRSSDRVAIGYRSGAVPLGYYQNAMFVYDNVLDLLVSPLHGVAVAGLSKARGNLGELRRLWHKALQTLAFFAMPAFGILAVTAQDLIEMLLGSKWANAGFLLGILALRGIPHCIERTLGWLHVTAGRTERWMRWGVLATCAQLAALACGLPFGPTGVVVAFVICTFALCIPAIAYSGTPLGIGAADVVDAVWRPMAGSLLAAATGFAVRHAWAGDFTAIGRVAALTAVYATVYLTIVVKLLGVRTPLQVAFALVGDALPDRFARVARSLRMFHGRE